MSNETTSLVLSICGIAAVVAVLIILTAFLVVRVLKGSLFGMAMMAMKIFSNPKDEESSALDIRSQSASRSRNIDLRAQARSVDFDSAVARYGGKQSTQTTPIVPPDTNVISAQTAPTDSRPPVLKNRRRRPNADEGEDADFIENFLGD